MKKHTALFNACMIVLASTALLMSAGCHKDDTKASSATEASATPIATVAPTKATLSPTKPAPTVPSATSTQPATLPTVQSATFNTQIATGTMPAVVPTGTEITSLADIQPTLSNRLPLNSPTVMIVSYTSLLSN